MENMTATLRAVAAAAGVPEDAVRLTAAMMRGGIEWTVEVRCRTSPRRMAWLAWGPGGASPALAGALAIEQIRRLAGTSEELRA